MTSGTTTASHHRVIFVLYILLISTTGESLPCVWGRLKIGQRCYERARKKKLKSIQKINMKTAEASCGWHSTIVTGGIAEQSFAYSISRLSQMQLDKFCQEKKFEFSTVFRRARRHLDLTFKFIVRKFSHFQGNIQVQSMTSTENSKRDLMMK